MTTLRHVTLSCDQPDCTATLVLRFGPDIRLWRRAVQQEAAVSGWVRRGSNDFCPAHAPTPVRAGYARCPRAGCGRVMAVLPDGALRRHRLLIDGRPSGPTCRDPETDAVHTPYPHLAQQGRGANSMEQRANRLVAAVLRVLPLDPESAGEMVTGWDVVVRTEQELAEDVDLPPRYSIPVVDDACPVARATVCAVLMELALYAERDDALHLLMLHDRVAQKGEPT